jgi:alpha-L-fucosidase
LEWNQGVVINYKYDKSFPTGVAVLDLERGKLDSVRRLPWQTDDAIGNESWGYAAGNTFKTAQYVVTNLIDIVSKNGNLLLNIGPRSDGTITDEETATLLGTGKWLDVNGEAIYGTRPWHVYGEGPTRSASGAFADQKTPFTAKDIRFTTKGPVLYAIILGLPHEKTVITNLGLKAGAGAIASIDLVGSTEKIRWTQRADALLIEPSATYPSGYAVVYKIGFK